MERQDLELEQRVWQRVSGTAPAGELPSLGEMERRSRESAAVFRQLAQSAAGSMRDSLLELHRQEQSSAQTLQGMRVLSGEEPEKIQCCPWTKTGVCRALALAYRRSCQAREDYAAHARSGEYSRVFSVLERTEAEKMARLLSLIALSRGG